VLKILVQSKLAMSCYDISFSHRVPPGDLKELYEFVGKILADNGFAINYFHCPKVEQDWLGRQVAQLTINVFVETRDEVCYNHQKKYDLDTSRDCFLDRLRIASQSLQRLIAHSNAELMYEIAGTEYNREDIKPLKIIYTDTEDRLMQEPVKYWIVKLVRN